MGGKREAESYTRIAATWGAEPGAILFLSDVVEELDAARTAGLATTNWFGPGAARSLDMHFSEQSDFNGVTTILAT